MDLQIPPPLPFKTRILLFLLYTSTRATRRRNGTVNRRIFNLLDLKSPPNPKQIKSVKTYDVALDPSRNLWFRVFVPTQFSSSKNLPVVVFFHGGGFVYFGPDTDSYDALCRRVARGVGAVVVSVNYRLAPEYKYPAQYDDGFDVLEFLDGGEKGKVLPENAELSSCFVAGDSAGGNLAHHVVIRACGTKFRQLKVIGLVAIQPFFGGEERMESEKRFVGSNLLSLEETDWYWASFLPSKESNRDHEAVNVSGPKAMDISKLEFPPTILFMGGFDLLQDWQKRYSQWLIDSGKEVHIVEYPNMIHAFYAFPEIKESAEVVAEMRDFIYKQIREKCERL